MTTHERWILYPLLFLTLGIAMRDKVVPPRVRAREVTANEIRCNQLDVGRAECQVMVVSRPDGKDSIQMGVVQGGGGRLKLCGKDGKQLVVIAADPTGQSGVIEIYNSHGDRQVQLRSTETGGIVTTIGHNEKIWVIMGHEGQHFGVFAQAPGLEHAIPLTLPWRFDTSPPPPAKKP